MVMKKLRARIACILMACVLVISVSPTMLSAGIAHSADNIPTLTVGADFNADTYGGVSGAAVVVADEPDDCAGAVDVSAMTIHGGVIPESNLTWEFDETTGVLRISGTGAMPDFDAFNPVDDDGMPRPLVANTPWRVHRNAITTAIIEHGVTTIGGNAFYDNNLTSATIPNSVTEIGWIAFAYNNLTSVTIPNSVTRKIIHKDNKEKP
jgi:hypothetical protein